MLIDKSHFKTGFLFYHTHKSTLNLRSFGFSSDPSREENSDKFLQGKFVAWSFDFFLQNDNWVFSSTSIFCTFHWCILLTAEEICWICLNFTALDQFFGMHPRANGRWVTDQSDSALYFCYVIMPVRPTVVFSPFSFPSPLSITRFYI